MHGRPYTFCFNCLPTFTNLSTYLRAKTNPCRKIVFISNCFSARTVGGDPEGQRVLELQPVREERRADPVQAWRGVIVLPHQQARGLAFLHRYVSLQTFLIKCKDPITGFPNGMIYWLRWLQHPVKAVFNWQRARAVWRLSSKNRLECFVIVIKS